jgi:hypothetical protein
MAVCRVWWMFALLCALHHPVGVVSRLSEKNNLAAVALTDVLHSGVKWLLQSSSAAWFLHHESSGLTTWRKEASLPEFTDILQFHTVGSRRELGGRDLSY